MIPHKGYVKPTAWERMRMDAIKKAGCILSRIRSEKRLEVPGNRTELQHIKDTTHTLGHAYTICLDVWYHQGRPPKGMSCQEAMRRFGAPLTAGRGAFFRSHGWTERGLWTETNKRMGMDTTWPASKVFKREAPVSEATRLTDFSTGE
jgi:hypothetical protein